MRTAMLNSLYTHGVWPATQPAYRGLPSRLRRWRAQERRSLDHNLAQQWESLRRLMRHACATSRFYRERFQAAGLNPDTMRHPEELRGLPPLTRDDLRHRLDDIASGAYPKASLTPAITGGTTETSVTFLRDRPAIAEKLAAQQAFNAWAQLRPGDRVLWLWGARADYPAHPSWRWKLYDQHLLRQMWLPTSRFNPEILEDYRLRLNRFRPRVIYAYPTPLEILCEYLETCGRGYWRPGSVICTAESLLPRQRARIERVFGCGVFEQSVGGLANLALQCFPRPDRLAAKPKFFAAQRFDLFAKDRRIAETWIGVSRLIGELIKPCIPFRHDLDLFAQLLPVVVKFGRDVFTAAFGVVENQLRLFFRNPENLRTVGRERPPQILRRTADSGHPLEDVA